MNRKLHHTLMALSATAAVFSVLLLAGGPLPPLSQRPLPLQATNPIPLTARATA
ncbi:MAG: hypothetical protein JWL98_423, partial [Xanthomonadaceae bacterium]|nr:hypothetical protein [Xanthomonadaceae bacterium]